MHIDIEKVANLAKLQLTSSEKDRFQKELEDILSYFDMLGEVDTTNIIPTYQSTGLTGKMREDIAISNNIHALQQELLKCSPHYEHHFIQLPSVF